MKRCGACGEEFRNQFNFCPVDGQTLGLAAVADFAYAPTLISDESLLRRLAIQVSFLIERSRAAWPRFKADPLQFLKGQFTQIKSALKLMCGRRNLMTGLAVSFAAVFCVVVTVGITDKAALHRTVDHDADDLFAPPTMISLQATADSDDQKGVGAGSNGRVGFNKGRGEGSGPTPARSQGGGGGGDGSQLAQSQGKVPPPSVIPAPISTTFARLPQALPVGGVDLDPVLWNDLPFPNYGDPRSKSTVSSNGPGEGGGVGTGKGTGIGEGDGNGFGPGRKNNIGGGDNSRGCCGGGGSNSNQPDADIDRVYRQPEVTTRARLLSKPEPQYTEEARRAQITGTVILSVVFSRTGQVTNIRTIQPLCCGLTEKAIGAARSIRFVPAMRGGQVVSTYMQLEYNFNLY
jgi:TonB family protein